MIAVEFDLVSASPLSFSKAITSIKDPGESHEAFEERTWRERMHVDKNGELFIPANALETMLVETAKFLAESVPGKGKATYTKHFMAGIMVTEPLMLAIKADTIQHERCFVSSDGKPGGSKRVWKNFPIVAEWKARGQIILLDPILIDKPEKVEEYLRYAGKFIGFLKGRPRRGGHYGRFSVENFRVIKKLKVA